MTQRIRVLLGIVFVASVGLTVMAKTVPSASGHVRPSDGIGWIAGFLAGLQAFIADYRSQVFVMGFMLAAVSLVLVIMWPRLEQYFAE